MGSLENRYDDEYPPLSYNEPDSRTSQDLINTRSNTTVDSFERKTLNIPQRSLPENLNEFYQTATSEVKKYGATLLLSKMASGSYNLDVRCPSTHLNNVIGIIRLLVERKVTRELILEPYIIDKLSAKDDILDSVISTFNGRISHEITNNTVYLNGVSKDVDEALEILKQKIEKFRLFEERSIDDIEPKYFILIRGPFDANLRTVISSCSNPVSIIFPPCDSFSKSIKVSGYKSDVDVVCAYLILKYKEFASYQETTIPLAPQFRDNVIRVSGIDKILKETGVAVYVSPDSNDKKIYLIGPEDDLAEAVPVILNRAKNYDVKELSCPLWVHNIIKDIPEFDVTNLKKEYKDLWFSYVSNKETIMLDGPSLIVKKISLKFSTKIAEIKNTYSSKLIQYSATFLNYLKLIGLQELNEKILSHNAQVDLGDATKLNKVVAFNSSLQMQLSGDKSEIDDAHKVVLDFLASLKQNYSLEIAFESVYLAPILEICTNNSVMDEIKKKCGSLVKVSLKTPRIKRQNYLNLFGMKGTVLSAELYFEELIKKVTESYTLKDLSIPKPYHYLIIGKGGSTRQRIIDETAIEKLFVPSADYKGSDSNIVTIFGEKSAVDMAESMIMEICNISVELDEVEISVNKVLADQLKLLNNLVLRKVIQNATKNYKEFGGPADVAVVFTTEEENMIHLKIRGPKKLVDIVSMELSRLSKIGLHTELVTVEETYFKSIIGRNGTNMQKLTGNLNASLVIPSLNQCQGKQNDKIVLMASSKGDLQKIRDAVLKFIKELKDIKEIKLKVPTKFSRKFSTRNGDEESLLYQYLSNYPSVKITLPKDGESEEFIIRGPSAFVDKLQKEMLNQINFWEKMITETITITNEHLVCARKQDKNIINTISDKYKVVIRLKKEKGVTAEDLDEITNRFAVTIEGLPSNVESVIKFFEENKPINDEIKVHKKHHSTIIGAKGVGLKKLLDGLNLSLKFPSNDDISEIISISGPAAHVERFKKRLQPLLNDMIKKQTDWEERNHMVELDVNPKWYSKLIGKGGSFVSNLKTQYDVNIFIPGVGNNANVVLLDHKFVTIRGEMNKINLAKKKIEAIVNEWENTEEEVFEVPKEFHGRLRGVRSANIKNLQRKHHVEVRFAPQGDLNDNNVYVKGRKENIRAAIKELSEIAATFMNEKDNDDYIDTNERYTIDKFQFSKRTTTANTTINQGKMENYNQGLKTLQEIYGVEKTNLSTNIEHSKNEDTHSNDVEPFDTEKGPDLNK